MGNLGFTEIMLIAVAVLLLFGAKRLPEIGSSMGKGIREFKRSLTDTQDAIMNPPRSDDAGAQNQQRQLDAPPSGSGDPKRLSQ